MGAETRHRREWAVAELLVAQHGVISSGQLAQLGVGRRSIAHRLAKRQLRVVHPGVYALGPLPLQPRGRWMAAVLACGEGALLSHWSAAALWGLLSQRGRLQHVTATRNRHARAGLVVHRAVSMSARDRDRRDGIPVTSLARTLLDVAAIDRGPAVARALEEADRLRMLRIADVEEVLARRRGQPGTRRLAEALALFRDPPATRSELERWFLELIMGAGLPVPAINVLVEGYLVDALWRQTGLVVELDGWEHHRGRGAFERDRARDVELRIAGYEVLRFTYLQLRDRPEQTIAAIRARLRAIEHLSTV